MGFNRPSKIQETALPMLCSRTPQNLIAQEKGLPFLFSESQLQENFQK